MNALFSIVPIWAWAIAAAVGWGAWQKHQAAEAADSLRLKEAAAATQREQGLRDSFNQTERRLNAQNKVVQNATIKIARANAAAASAAGAGERLRARLAVVNASQCAPGAAAAVSGQAASSPADLREYVQRRLDDAADQLARHADDARAAGQACEQAYDALSEPVPGGSR